MKNFIKTILAASLMLAGISLRAAEAPTSLEQFSQLPKELQVQIFGSINESKNLDDAIKRLAQLRGVSHQVKGFIESPYSGKFLMQKIADRFPPQIDPSDPARRVNYSPLMVAAANLGTPGASAWIKEQSEKNPEFKDYVTYGIDDLARASMSNWPTKVPLFLLKIGVHGKDQNWFALEYALSLEPLLSPEEAGEKELDLNGKEFNKFDEFLSRYNLNINGIDSDGKTILDHYEERSNHLFARNRARFLRLKGAKTAAELLAAEGQ